jgi:hypothetical protein
MVKLAGIVVLLLLPGTASAASPLRPPSLGEREAILRWADRHPGVAGDAGAVNRICVHRARPRHAVVRFARFRDGRAAVLLRRRGGRWRRSDGGAVLRDLRRRSCALLPTPGAPPLNRASTLAAGAFGPLELGMTFGGAQWATRTRLLRDDLFNLPCQTFRTRRLNTGFFGLTTNGVIRQLDISSVGLATAEGLRVGEPEARVTATYGPPFQRRPAPYLHGGEELVYRTTVDPAAPRLRVVTVFEGRVHDVAVGFTPEVDFDEGCA